MTIAITLYYFCYSFVFLYHEGFLLLFYTYFVVFYKYMNKYDIIFWSPINLTFN